MTSDVPAADMCQCAKAKGDYTIEGELGATVIYPDCHLEEPTFPEPDNAEQPGLISEKDVYVAFTGSPALLKIAEKHPNDQSIRKAVRKRERGHQGVKDLIRKYGILSVVAAIRVLLDDSVFTLPRPKEEQETATGHPYTREIEPLDGECGRSDEAADGFEADGLPSSRPGQSPRDCRLPIRTRQRLMSQMQLLLEHACFEFGQPEMQQELDKWDCSCAEAVSLPTWIEFFMKNKTLETEDNAGSLSTLLSSNAEEFIQLLGAPTYLDAVRSLRRRIEEVLLMANRDASSIHNGANRKVAQIEAQRERLNREEEGVKRHRDEDLDNIRDSIERDIFAAMGQAKDTLPGIGLADNR
ncbi:hypothetical protein FANTH_14066 [Fusarium anthophilum]|uniref:Uncharacterized protein n=1 Tax=Fusarium anthophilum TaxID=48485 RepID=A0A8H4YKV8_9HYPO|nr:hypothetical protein FANTH_14066 [Fusarium anthophilum]